MNIPLPSFSTLMNLYSAYSFGGPRHTAALATTSIADGALSSYYGLGRNYVSLSSFWGYVAYNASKAMPAALPTAYKIPLSVLSLLVSAGMVWQGKDIFAKTDYNETLGSVKLTASFFDDKGTIAKAEKEFSKGYWDGIKYTAQNFPSLISNKLVLYTLGHCTIDIGTQVLKQMFFNQFVPQGKNLALISVERSKPFDYLKVVAQTKIANFLLTLISDRLASVLMRNITKELDIKVAKLVLQEKNTTAVMELGAKVQQLPYGIASIYQLSKSSISSLVQRIISPFTLNKNTDKSDNSTTPLKTLESYSSMILVDGLIETIFSQANFSKIMELINKRIFGINTEETGECETQEVQGKLGLPGKISMIVTPENYTYGNIQEIAKLGGNEFMRKKLFAYLESKHTANYSNQQGVFASLNLLKSLVEELAFTGIFLAHEITLEKYMNIDTDIMRLMAVLGLYSDDVPVDTALPKVETIKSTVETLRKKRDTGPKRLLSDDMTLSLENYHLGKKDKSTDMLFIEKMQFHPGFIYAIIGTIGSGKTTLLSDIAKVMMPFFRSSGTIKYPVTSDGKIVEEIFCGSIPFSPPATTLLERLTYRIPSKYVETNKFALEEASLTLLKELGQKDFTKEILNTKGNDASLKLSTGQGKIIMLISAILYKQYLKKPTLFVLDETLANLDEATTKLVCSTIKKQFKDSIVISVDHNARHNPDFYYSFVDLAQYTPPQNNDVPLAGEGG